jgi:formylglycine-generating enzyme required for sulfatase activity
VQLCATRREVCKFGFILGLLFLASCGRSGTDSPAASNSSNSVPAISAAAGEPFEVTTKSGVEMIYLPGGEFTMGSDRGNPDEAPSHRVKVTGFLMDKFEVTHALFAKAQLPNPSHWQDNPAKPVERVRWRDAKQYCNERSIMEGLQPCYDEKTPDLDCNYQANGYRLPTEAEWEYASRAGTAGEFDFGAGDKLKQFAWFDGNADAKTHPVGQKKPNRWGFFDLYGNVSEWCEDVYSPVYYKESPSSDPRGPASPGKDVMRVIRGGSWKASVAMCRASFREGQRTGDTDACFYTDFCGFRCVRKVSLEELSELRKLKP